jgi:hypothetical protein
MSEPNRIIVAFTLKTLIRGYRYVMLVSIAMRTTITEALAFLLFLRREGLRVAYFGDDMPTGALAEVVRSGSFAAFCLSVTAITSLLIARIVLRELIEVDGGMLYVGGRSISRAMDGEADAIPAMRLSESVTAAPQQVASELVP